MIYILSINMKHDTRFISNDKQIFNLDKFKKLLFNFILLIILFLSGAF